MTNEKAGQRHFGNPEAIVIQRTQYLSAVRGMAMSEKGGAEYRRNEDEVMQMWEEVFILLGIDAENTLREEGFRERNKIMKAQEARKFEELGGLAITKKFSPVPPV